MTEMPQPKRVAVIKHFRKNAGSPLKKYESVQSIKELEKEKEIQKIYKEVTEDPKYVEK